MNNGRKMVESNSEETHVELNNQNSTIDTRTKEPDNFYEELAKQVHSDFLKLKEIEEGSLKMRKEIALLKLEVASALNPKSRKAESTFEANIMKATETVQEIDTIMSQEIEDISNLLSESNHMLE